MAETALYPVVAVATPDVTAAEFRQLFDLDTVFETDWYVHLKSADDQRQIGLIQADHESLPAEHRYPVRGALVTVDVPDVSALWDRVSDRVKVLLPLTDEVWGQRHFIAELAGGVAVDVVQLLPPEK